MNDTDDPLYGSMGDTPWVRSSDTSEAAADSLSDTELSRLETLVRNVIAAWPCTCDAVEERTGLAHQTVSARIRALVLREHIIDSGRRALTRHGRQAVIWRIKTPEDRALEAAQAVVTIEPSGQLRLL